MPISLAPNQLLSRVVRFNASNGVTGGAIISGSAGTVTQPRKINLLARLSGGEDDGGGGLLDRIWNAGSALVGFIGRILGGIGFSLTRLWGWLVDRIEQLKSFNWNASDTQLGSLIEAQNIQIASLWGGVVGQGLGWLAGIGVGYGVAFLCPVVGGSLLAKSVSGRVAEEAVSEILPNMTNALTQTVGALANNTLISGYMQIRRLIKSADSSLLTSVFGEETARWIQDEWGSGNGPDLSFNSQVDEAIESIDNTVVQAFVENLLDEAWDSFLEAGFIIAHELDDAFQQARAANNAIEGPERTIELTPDINAPTEVLTFEAVPQTQLQTQIQTTINTHRQVWNRDVGQIVGTSYEEHTRARPQLRKLSVEFKAVEAPPWRNADGTQAKTATYSIPDVRLGLSWQDIITACPPYSWGKFCARATLDNQRQMAVYGATAEEARQQLLRMHTLSDSNILRLTVSEEEFVAERLRKRATPMFPVYATLMARYQSLDAQGRTTLDNRTFDEQTLRIPLWFEPRGFTPL